MPVIKSEDFDGVMAPALPSGWTFDSPLVTTSTPDTGISPTSSPNMLELPLQIGGTHYFATYGTPDSNSGDVIVQCNFNSDSPLHNQTWGLIARADVSAVIESSSTFYWVQLDLNRDVLELHRVAAGTDTLLDSVSIIGLYTQPGWFQPMATFSGSTPTAISISVLEVSSGKYLDSSGNFVSTFQNAISYSDSSPITGSGHAGISLQAWGRNNFADDWTFNTYSSPPPPTTHATMYDRVKESTSTTGAGPVLLLGAQFGFQSFAVVGDGNYVYYGIQDSATPDWEVGLGSYDASGPSLNRLVVYDSSAGPGVFVNLQAGSYKDVFNTCPSWLLNSLMGLL